MEDIEKKIYNSAKKLFEKYSPKKVSIDMIVKEAGVWKWTFYNYFKNKEDIYEQIIFKFGEKQPSEEKLKNILKLEPEKRLFNMFILISKMSFKNTIMMNIFLWNKNYFIGKIDYEYFEKIHFQKLKKIFSDSSEDFDIKLLSDLMWLYLDDLVQKQKEFTKEELEKYSIKLAWVLVKWFLSNYEKFIKNIDISEIWKDCSN